MIFASGWWPALFSIISVVLGVVAAVHAAMTKDDVRAALGWVGVALLSPIIGPILYAVAGINLIRRQTVKRRRRRSQSGDSDRPDRSTYQTEILARDIIQIADGLGWDRFSVVGQSMGGHNGMQAAMDHPDRIEKLVISDMEPLFQLELMA